MSPYVVDRLGSIASGCQHGILAILGYAHIGYSPQTNHNENPPLTSNLHPYPLSSTNPQEHYFNPSHSSVVFLP